MRRPDAWTAQPWRLLVLVCLTGTPTAGAQTAPADLLILNGRVYTFAWDDPAGDGAPAANAPRTPAAWRPDAEAVAIRDGRIVFVGSAKEAQRHRGARTRVLDARGGTVIPLVPGAHHLVVAAGIRDRRGREAARHVSRFVTGDLVREDLSR